MKKINLLFIIMISMFFGALIVNADTEPMNASVTITGRNDFGRSLGLTAHCDASLISCSVKSAEWYYSDDVVISEDDTQIERCDKRSCVIPKAAKGKYIYVKAVVTGVDGSTVGLSGDNEEEATDFTDNETNNSATVSGYYTLQVSDPINYSISTSVSGTELSMSLSGATDDDIQYYVYFTGGNNVGLLNETEEDGCVITPDKTNIDAPKAVGANGKIDIDNDWYILKNYQSAQVIKKYELDGKYYCDYVRTTINVNRPSLPSYGNRFGLQSISNQQRRLSITPKFPYTGSNGDHILEVKIGLAGDEIIDYLLDDDYANAIAKIKNADGVELSLPEAEATSMGEFVAQENKIYYVYVTYENGDQLYRNIEEVLIAKGTSDGILTSVALSDISGNGQGAPTNEPEPNNPSDPGNEPEPESPGETYTFKVIYDANGGTGEMSSQTVTSGEDITLTANKFKKLGDIFRGWNLYLEDAKGNRTAYKDSNGVVLQVEDKAVIKNLEVPKGYNLVLVAEWTPNTGVFVPVLGTMILLGASAVAIYLTNKKKAFIKL